MNEHIELHLAKLELEPNQLHYINWSGDKVTIRAKDELQQPTGNTSFAQWSWSALRAPGSQVTLTLHYQAPIC